MALFVTVQGGDLQWLVGRVLEGVALENKGMYQQILSKWRKNQTDLIMLKANSISRTRNQRYNYYS